MHVIFKYVCCLLALYGSKATAGESNPADQLHSRKPSMNQLTEPLQDSPAATSGNEMKERTIKSNKNGTVRGNNGGPQKAVPATLLSIDNPQGVGAAAWLPNHKSVFATGSSGSIF